MTKAVIFGVSELTDLRIEGKNSNEAGSVVLNGRLHKIKTNVGSFQMQTTAAESMKPSFFITKSSRLQRSFINCQTEKGRFPVDLLQLRIPITPIQTLDHLG